MFPSGVVRLTVLPVGLSYMSYLSVKSTQVPGALYFQSMLSQKDRQRRARGSLSNVGYPAQLLDYEVYHSTATDGGVDPSAPRLVGLCA